MKRMIRTVVILSLAFAYRAGAHFVFIVPDPGGTKATVVLSEDLGPDADVDAAPLMSAKLFARDTVGHETAMSLAKGEHACTAELPGSGQRLLHGLADLGVHQRGNAKPMLLEYHPKTIVGGDPFAKIAPMKGAPIEIVPVGKAGALCFEVRVDGKPAGAGIEVNVIPPDGKQRKLTTGAAGRTTEPFAPLSRYGAWAKSIEPVAGERDGRRYEEVRHYATLVIDVPRYAPMPEAVSSFGAVATGGWLYVYGGHVAPTHDYSTAAVSGQFHRLNLSDGRTWDTLPGGPHVQGMNLAAHDGKVYRVGGMEPRNAPGEPADNYSLADAARFDPATGRWEALPAMPEGRSSHDVAVIGETLYVVGGWTMNGSKGGNRWPDSMLTMDLSKSPLRWTTVKQPFQRRALIGAAHQGRLHVLGGFDEASEASREVNVFDPKTGAWSKGPELPGKDRNGFAPAACEGPDGHLYVSVADGSLYRLDDAGGQWERAGATTPRIVHRLAPWRSEILVIGGAAGGKNFDLIESVEVPAAAGAAAR